MHWVKESFSRVLGTGPKTIGMNLIYDVAHNIAKVEEHVINGRKRTLVVHRKGATRAFPPGHPELPGTYRHLGQPVIIPGDMGRASFVLIGTEQGMKESFGSTCHGAGRVMSRHQAIRKARGRSIQREMEGGQAGEHLQKKCRKPIKISPVLSMWSITQDYQRR
jgi:tRNA-splicing ligase RtcB